nr:MAG TPA: hypothetical protein [Caudoviricetes sp.]
MRKSDCYVWCKSTPHQESGQLPDRQALRYSLPNQ